MDRLFIRKFQQGDQLEKNYYRFETLDESSEHFNGLKAGDYVLLVQKRTVSKLFRFIEFETVGESTKAKLETVKEFSPEITTSTISFCKYLKPDMVLMNKAVKSKMGDGLHPLQLESSCPSIVDIDFNKDKRRYYICTKKKLANVSFFKPSDICVVTSDSALRPVVDIVEFNGQSFEQHVVLRALFDEKNKKNGKQFALKELLDFAPKYDDTKTKENYLTAVIQSLEDDGLFAVDNVVSLYDNVIVGRKVPFQPKKKEGITSVPILNKETDSEVGIDFEDLSAYEQYARLLEFNPNIILYGPPGTGKTYGAMRIIEAFEQKNGNPVSFKQVISEHRAKFITFHQAFSYEEFVEGIRPRVDEDGNISYPVEHGILKEIAEDCRIQGKKSLEDFLVDTTSNSKVWKVSLGRRNEANKYRTLRDKNVIAIEFEPSDQDVSEWNDSQFEEFDSTGMLKVFRNKVAIGDIVLIFDSIKTIRLIGVVTSDYFYTDEDSFGYRHRRSVKWLKVCEEEPINIFELNHNKQLTLSSIYELKIPVANVVSLMDNNKEKDSLAKPYYLVIDEINRGNIAKIFGELITLIEKDKRENLSCTLPYSKDLFTLPKNLYIIGTMNTSDRSIALLDTALRRRFAFVEVNPDVTLLEIMHPTIGGNVSPAKLLQALNNKITEKYDRDHRIGHSYFLGEELVTKYDLFNAWYYKVFPLLMEYFYNDIKRVSEIVGSEFFDRTTNEIVQLSTKPNEENISVFESALIKIYKGED